MPLCLICHYTALDRILSNEYIYISEYENNNAKTAVEVDFSGTIRPYQTADPESAPGRRVVCLPYRRSVGCPATHGLKAFVLSSQDWIGHLEKRGIVDLLSLGAVLLQIS